MYYMKHGGMSFFVKKFLKNRNSRKYSFANCFCPACCLVIGVILVYVFTGCSNKQMEVTLPYKVPDNFSHSGSLAVPDRYWISFQDTHLNELLDTVLTSNMDILSAWERLRASRAIAEKASARLFPFLDFSASGEINRPGGDFEEDQRFQMGLNTQYEVDLWGRIRASADAKELRSRAAFAEYKSTALAVASEVIMTWFRLAERKSQLDLINRQIEINRQMLDLMNNRFGNGRVRSVDIFRQQQLLESVREQKYFIESQVEVLTHQLMILGGIAPSGELVYTPNSLSDLPAFPDTGIPVELIRRRPDIQNAFYQLQAADRELAAAISSQYPRLSFTFSVSSVTGNANKLFEQWVYAVGGNLLAPLFYGKQLSAEVDRTEAVKNQRLYEYGKAVLIAFREVESALENEKNQKKIIHQIKKQLVLAEKTYEQVKVGYFNGVTDYLDVLTARDGLEELQRDMLSANLQLIEYRVLLYKSLAGGFEIPGDE
jgi:NodT family efflux transporter outer membrane factor (OMF) lipoprotein